MVSQVAFGQELCKSTIYDQATGKPVSKATVIYVKERGGKLLGFGRTNGFGRLTTNLPTNDSLKIFVKHSRYIPLELNSYPCKDTLRLYPKSKVLKEVIVTGNKAVTMNGDTVSFVADSFKVPAGATVEDLLKRLPGVQVATDGTIKSNGKKIERVLVDGDDFFGNDATVATRNLEASMIDKVEVIDVESAKSRATGESDAEKAKIINLKLKEDAKKGYFGKVKAGYSNTNRYESTNMANVFKGKLKAGVYAIFDNINARMSWQDRQDMGMGNGNWYYDEDLDQWIGPDGENGSNGMWGFIPGNMHVGALFSKQFEDGSGKISANYSNKRSRYTGNILTSNTMLLNDIRRSTSSVNQADITNSKHDFDLRYEYRIDTSNKVSVAFGTRIQNNDGVNVWSEEILVDSTLTNKNQRENPFQFDRQKYDLGAEYEHKFKKKGRFAGLTLGILSSNQISESNNIQNGNQYDSMGNTTPLTLDQLRTNYDQNRNFKAAITYIEPLIKDKLFIDFGLSGLMNNSKSFNNTYNKQSGIYDQRIDALSNNYRYDVNAYSQAIKLRYKSKKIESSLGAKLQESNLNQVFLDSGKSGLERSFLFLLPNYQFMWKYKRNSNLTFNFNTNVTPPQLMQIQPFVNNSNPQNITSGNPNLTPSYVYRFSLSNSFWYPISQSNLWTSINYRRIQQDIVSQTSVDETGNVRQSYTQVDGNYSINGNTYYSFLFKPWKIQVSNGLNGNFNQTSQVVNNVITPSERIFLSYWANLNKTIDSTYTAELSFNIDYSKTTIANRPSNNTQYGISISSSHDYTFKNKIKLSSEITANILPPSGAYATSQSFYLLNAGIERSFLTDNAMTAKLFFYDILGQNRAVNRYVSDNNINESINQALTQYVMLSLTYKFKNKRKGNEEDTGL